MGTRTELDPGLLRTFVTVAETRSFTRAAGRLHRVQSAVSMQIRRLEAAVGHRLFDRNRRSVALTPEGERLLGYARRILSLNREALAELREPWMEGVVRLGASDVSSYLLPGILARFAAACPRIQLEIRCDRSWHLLDALDGGELDLVLVSQHPGRADAQLVRREPLVWAAADGSAVADRDPVPLALFARGCIYRDAALAALDECGRPWRLAYSSTNPVGLKAAVSAGLAVTVAVRSTLDEGLRVLGAEDGFPPLPPIEITLHRAAGEGSPLAARLAREIVGVVAGAA